MPALVRTTLHWKRSPFENPLLPSADLPREWRAKGSGCSKFPRCTGVVAHRGPETRGGVGPLRLVVPVSRVPRMALLELSSWKRALASLERALVRSEAAPDDEELRDAVIQRFEYSYELSWKMLKRHLEQVLPNPGLADQWSFKELMREAAERGLVGSIDPWLQYRYQRNLTAHAYDEEKARAVFEGARGLLSDARALLSEVERRNVA